MRAATLLCALLAAACSNEAERASWAGQNLDRSESGDVTDLRVQTASFQAGPQQPRPRIENPFADAVDEGERFYTAFNCGGCHGARGGGGMGPPLAREHFIYGNEPQNIFQSIVQGRPYGMPAFGGTAPDDVVWKIAAYVRHMSTSDEYGPADTQTTGSVGGGQ